VPVVGAAAETWRTCESCTLRRRLSLRHDAAVPGTGARPEKAGEAPGWLTPLGATVTSPPPFGPTCSSQGT
jgi:hypothetical protein